MPARIFGGLRFANPPYARRKFVSHLVDLSEAVGMTGGRLPHYGARRSGQGRRDRMVLVALPKMTEGTPPDPLARLGERLAKAEAGQARQRPSRPGGANLQEGLSLGLRIGLELVVAVVVGTGLGWAFDYVFGTQPWGTLVLFFLGGRRVMIKD